MADLRSLKISPEISEHFNTDYTGSRTIKGTKEFVEYYNNTSHRIWLNTQTENYDSHWHEAMEIIMPVESYYDIYTNDEHYHILPGNIAIIPPGELHSLTAPSHGQRFIFLLDISSISKLKGYVGIQTLFAKPLVLTPEEYPLIFDDIYDLLIQIRNVYFENGEYAELAIQSLILNMFIKIGENHNNTDELFPNVRFSKQKEYVQKFNQLLKYIDDHYMEELTLDSIAYMAGFSKYHFSRLFKQYTDFTFCDYLNYRRIKAATELLAHPNYSITEIALNSGFPSISTFNRLFKQTIGYTPREYRNKNAHSNKKQND